jgi:hypothetical protein
MREIHFSLCFTKPENTGFEIGKTGIIPVSVLTIQYRIGISIFFYIGIGKNSDLKRFSFFHFLKPLFGHFVLASIYYFAEKSEFPALEKCLPYFSNHDIEENRYWLRLGSFAGPVIQVTGRSEFEDGLGSGDFVSDYSYHMSVRTRLPNIMKQTKFQSQRPNDVKNTCSL